MVLEALLKCQKWIKQTRQGTQQGRPRKKSFGKIEKDVIEKKFW